MTVIWFMIPEIWNTTDRTCLWNTTDRICHSGPFFALPRPLHPHHITTRKIKVFKKWNKHVEISSLYIDEPKIMIKCYPAPERLCVTEIILNFYFGLFFALLIPYRPKKSKFKKNEKRPGDIIILHMSTNNNDHMMYGCWNMVHNRRTDGQTEKVKHRGRWPT